MASIENIKASDGSGNADLATVQSSRSIGATTIDVDTVAGINPAGFMGSMGTPHTFTDPITSETITVISEATCVDFAGHVDGSNLEIDTIAPGYADLGSAVGDIIIIRPTTQYGNNLATILGVSLANDGSVRATSPKVITGINDTNGNELFKVTPTASAVNEFTVTNAATANAPILSATGSDTDVGITITPKGAGKLTLNGLYNAYKFRAYRSAAINAVNSTATKMAFDAESYDTSSNFASGTFTAPVAGFYHFAARLSVVTTRAFLMIYKNGAEYSRGNDITVASGTLGPVVTDTIQLAASDTVEIYYFVVGTAAIDVGPTQNYFSGFLLSRF